MNPYHARQARLIIDRANKRTRNRRGNEARAERAKVRELPTPDSTRHSKDRQPPIIYSPQSSWGSITKGVVVTEYLDGVKVTGPAKKPARPNAGNSRVQAEQPTNSL